MATFSYLKPYAQLTPAKLLSECVAAGLPVTDVQTVGDVNETIYVVTSRDLTPAEVTTLNGVVAAHDGRPRRKRRLIDVFNAIGALTTAQKTAISADLFGGTPPKLSTDDGDDAADLLVCYCLSQTGLSTADKNLVKQSAAAIYCRDNPTYLVNQTFGGTVAVISVPGDEVVS